MELFAHKRRLVSWAGTRLALLLLAGLILLPAPPGALALDIDAFKSLTPKFELDGKDEFAPIPVDPKTRLLQNLSRGALNSDLFIHELILGESWEEWITFQSSLQPYMPIQSLKRIIHSSGSHPGLIRHSGESRPKKTGGVALSRGLDELEKYLFTYSGKPKGESYGNISFDYKPMNKEANWNLVGFLMEEDGLFSGKEWDWDNFLPRLGTVAAILGLGLFITEFFHYLVKLGTKRRR